MHQPPGAAGGGADQACGCSSWAVMAAASIAWATSQPCTIPQPAPAMTCHWSLGLAALGDGAQVDGVGEGDDRAEEAVRLGARAERGHEAAVDLHRVDRQTLQIGQRGIAGAEIVHRHPHRRGRASVAARAPRPRASAPLSVTSMQTASPGTPSAARIAASSVLSEPSVSCLAETLIEIVSTGRDRRQKAIWRIAPASTQAPIRVIRPASSARGMNSVGDTQPRSGVAPAYQRLESADAPIGHVHLRLVVDLELVARHRPETGPARSACWSARRHAAWAGTSPPGRRPRALAAYIAASAWRISRSGPAGAAHAMPMLALTCRPCPRSNDRLRQVLDQRRAPGARPPAVRHRARE